MVVVRKGISVLTAVPIPLLESTLRIEWLYFHKENSRLLYLNVQKILDIIFYWYENRTIYRPVLMRYSYYRITPSSIILENMNKLSVYYQIIEKYSSLQSYIPYIPKPQWIRWYFVWKWCFDESMDEKFYDLFDIILLL